MRIIVAVGMLAIAFGLGYQHGRRAEVSEAVHIAASARNGCDWAEKVCHPR